MFKILLIVIVTSHVIGGIHSNDQDDLFVIIDNIFSPLVPIGVPETPLVEDPHKLKKLCQFVNVNYLKKLQEKIESLITGVLRKVGSAVFAKFSTNNIVICQLLKNEELEKASLMAKEYNRHLSEANKLRLSLLTAFKDLTEKGTKTSFPILTCYLKQFSVKMVDIYPDKDGAKILIKSVIDHIFDDIFIKTLEKETGKASDNCPLPEVISNSLKFNSVFIGFLTTVLNLQNK